MVTLILCAATCLCMILGVLFFPKIGKKPFLIDSYWVITLVGAALVLLFGEGDVAAIGEALIENTAVNPLKILVLFLSMTVLSVFLDELGFFRALASFALRHVHGGQKRLFLSLYLTVSILTVFTSNDIIVLSFTPFICYFASNAKIDPLPYLAAEFVAANTWSMALIIGNPTNIYLAAGSGIGFLEYAKVSILPTLAGGITAFFALLLLFRKKLSLPLTKKADREHVEDKLSLGIGVFHLAVCTVLLALSSYLGWEMWLISLCSVGSLFLFESVACLIRRKLPRALGGCVKRAPWQLVPFLLSMFVMMEALNQTGVTAALGNFLGTQQPVLRYGILSFLGANLINNIPMSVLFSAAIRAGGAGLGAVYATAVGSNIGAFFTPIGALAGIMWSGILGEHGVKFGYLSFLKIGVFIALPTLAASLGALSLALLWA